MTGGFLDIAERDTGIESGGDERAPQRVGTDPLLDPGTAGDPPDDPGGTVTVESSACAVAEDRAFAALADGEIDCTCGAWCERDRHGLAALALDDESAVTTLKVVE